MENLSSNIGNSTSMDHAPSLVEVAEKMADLAKTYEFNPEILERDERGPKMIQFTVLGKNEGEYTIYKYERQDQGTTFTMKFTVEEYSDGKDIIINPSGKPTEGKPGVDL